MFCVLVNETWDNQQNRGPSMAFTQHILAQTSTGKNTDYVLKYLLQKNFHYYNNKPNS